MVELQGDACKHLTPFMRTQIVEIDAEFRTRSDRLGQLEKQMHVLATSHPFCKLLLTMPGIGPVNATAIVSAIGTGDQFEHPRDFAVWLGLTPSQYASGKKIVPGQDHQAWRSLPSQPARAWRPCGHLQRASPSRPASTLGAAARGACWGEQGGCCCGGAARADRLDHASAGRALPGKRLVTTSLSVLSMRIAAVTRA